MNNVMPDTLTLLRRKIARLETTPPLAPGDGVRAAIDPGFPAVAAALTTADGRHGLVRGAVHEILYPRMPGGGADGAATAFALRLLSGMAREEEAAQLLWATCRDDLHGPGLLAAGVDPGRLLIARCPALKDVLWALEDALRCTGLTAAVADAAPLDFTISRRLSLAAAESSVTLFLLMPEQRPLPASAAMTRWRVTPAPGGLWRLELLRARGGIPPARWHADPVAGNTRPVDADPDFSETAPGAEFPADFQTSPQAATPAAG